MVKINSIVFLVFFITLSITFAFSVQNRARIGTHWNRIGKRFQQVDKKLEQNNLLNELEYITNFSNEYQDFVSSLPISLGTYLNYNLILL